MSARASIADVCDWCGARRRGRDNGGFATAISDNGARAAFALTFESPPYYRAVVLFVTESAEPVWTYEFTDDTEADLIRVGKLGISPDGRAVVVGCGSEVLSVTEEAGEPEWTYEPEQIEDESGYPLSGDLRDLRLPGDGAA